MLRHKYPKTRLEDIFDEAMEALLDKKDPERKIARVEKRKQNRFPAFAGNDRGMDPRWSLPLTPIKGGDDNASAVGHDNASTRYIPQHVRREVYLRDNGQCVYQSPDGKKCQEKSFLEADHVRPFALGGKSTAENLQLLCKTHNHYRARQTFGILRA